MKKLTAFLLVMALIFSFSGCGSKNSNNKELTETTTESLTTTIPSTEAQTEAPTENSTAANSEDATGGGIITVDKYRGKYYSIPQQFADIVGNEVFDEWFEAYEKTPRPDRMAMLDYIQHFNISREDFDKACIENFKIINRIGDPVMRPMDYDNQESYEIYNADIIYTFDDEIVNAYYLGCGDYPYLYKDEFEEAYAAGYKPRTEGFVVLENNELKTVSYEEYMQIKGKPLPTTTAQ